MKKFTRIMMAAIICGIFLPSVYTQPCLRIPASFYSQALDEVRKVDIFIPADYYVNLEQQYAAIYSLHGAGGNQNSHAFEAMLYYSLHSEDKLLRTQMNPHFLFNSLTSIQNFIIKEKPGLASDYLSRFSKLVRQILDNSTQEFVPLEQEIEAIENYLALQKVRYRDLFDYQIDVDEDIDPEATRVPPMLAQPFIENSIEHGFKNKGSKGNLSIRFIYHDSFLRVEIEDDGIGREKAKQIRQQSNSHHKSLSTNITRERLSALNRKSKNKISLNIEDLTERTGTKVTINIPDHLTT